MTPIEQALWALAGVLAIVAVVVLYSTVAPGSNPRSTFVPASPTRLASGDTTALPTRTRTPSATPSLTPLPTLEPLVMPTPPVEGVQLTLPPDPNRTGWLGSKELGPHWRDRNLTAGVFQGESFVSLVQYDLRNLAPGTKILFAALEVTGRNSRYLGTEGEWTIDVADTRSVSRWDETTYDLVRNLPALITLGDPMKAQSLGIGVTKRFVFTPEQLQLLQEHLLDAGTLTLRLHGPSGAGDNLFTWDAGPGTGEPTLYLSAIPAVFTLITPTSTPENVFAAATLSVKQTLQARNAGTPTPLPRLFATATSGAARIVVTSVPTPNNPAAATLQAAYATAVAVTTGTFTPTPLNWVTATPLPVIVPLDVLTPIPTATPTLNAGQLTQLALPATLYNKMVFLSGSRSNPTAWVIDADGKNLGQLSDRLLYDIAAARDAHSPNGVYYAYNAPDANGILQIWRTDLNFANVPPRQLTFLQSGFAFGPAWSPDGTKIAYTSSETGAQEVMIMDVETRRAQQLTTAKDWFWNQFPSWSPDGKRIVFASDRGHSGALTELWIMNVDGTVLYKLGETARDAWAPVWVKWRE